jgi:outer membrane protein assembly factor BamB
VGERAPVVRVLATALAVVAFAFGPATSAGSQVVLSGTSAEAPRPTGPEVDFPAYMYDGGHSAFSPAATTITPSSTLKLKYLFTEQSTPKHPRPEFISTPLVLGHVIYIGSNSGEFYAIDEVTGTVIWKEFLGFEAKFECPGGGFYATAASGIDPTSGALTLYAPSGDGNVYALRASDGTVLWKAPVNVPTPGMDDYFNYSSPEIANGKIYVGISSKCDDPLVRGGLVSLDQATGAQLAVYYTVPQGQVGGSIWTSPAIANDGSVIVTTGNGLNGTLVGDTQSIVRLDPNTLARLDGYQVVTSPHDSDFGGSPTVFSATLKGVTTPMVGACNKTGFYYAWKLNALSAGPVWKVNNAAHQNGTGICVSGAVWDGSNLYLAGTRSTIGGVSFRGSIRKLNPATGATIWATGLPAAIMTSPTLDGAGTIVAASRDSGTSVTNSAFLIDANTGTYVTINDGNQTAAPSPVFADQYLIIATSVGQIYTYETQ